MTYDEAEPTPETQTILGIRMTPEMREKIKALAAADGRTESGFARFHLARIVDRVEGQAEIEETTAQAPD